MKRGNHRRTRSSIPDDINKILFGNSNNQVIAGSNSFIGSYDNKKIKTKREGHHKNEDQQETEYDVTIAIIEEDQGFDEEKTPRSNNNSDYNQQQQEKKILTNNERKIKQGKNNQSISEKCKQIQEQEEHTPNSPQSSKVFKDDNFSKKQKLQDNTDSYTSNSSYLIAIEQAKIYEKEHNFPKKDSSKQNKTKFSSKNKI